MYLLLHCVLIKMRWIYGMVANCKIKNRYRVGIGSVEYSHTLKWGREQTIALLSRFNIKRRAKQTSQRTSHCIAAAVRSIPRISTLRLTHDSKVYVKIFQLFWLRPRMWPMISSVCVRVDERMSWWGFLKDILHRITYMVKHMRVFFVSGRSAWCGRPLFFVFILTRAPKGP